MPQTESLDAECALLVAWNGGEVSRDRVLVSPVRVVAAAIARSPGLEARVSAAERGPRASSRHDTPRVHITCARALRAHSNFRVLRP